MSTQTANIDRVDFADLAANFAQGLGMALATFPKDIWFKKELLSFQAGLPSHIVEELLTIFVAAKLVECHPKSTNKIRVSSKAIAEAGESTSQLAPREQSTSPDVILALTHRALREMGFD